jgi:hypothetical protein
MTQTGNQRNLKPRISCRKRRRYREYMKRRQYAISRRVEKDTTGC